MPNEQLTNGSYSPADVISRLRAAQERRLSLLTRRETMREQRDGLLARAQTEFGCESEEALRVYLESLEDELQDLLSRADAQMRTIRASS